MKRRALITGIAGQDGAYLAQLLLQKGYQVFGLHRPERTDFWRLHALGIFDGVQRIPGDLRDRASLEAALETARPDELYNLAALTGGGQASFDAPIETLEVNGLGAIRWLELLRDRRAPTRLFQACSSEIFGNSRLTILREESPKAPFNPYGAAKLMAAHMGRLYRDRYGLFAVQGILFNHDSPLRSPNFVTRKISSTVARIALGLEKKITLGNLHSRRDWGYAPEYAEAMWRMLQAPTPEDFVIATGRGCSVGDLVKAAFGVFHLRPTTYLKVESAVRPQDRRAGVGGPAKIRKRLGWTAKTRAEEMIRIMTRVDFENFQRLLKGETFPWDLTLPADHRHAAPIVSNH